MGQAPILAYMCYEKLLKFFGKRKLRKSVDKSNDERRSYTNNICRLEHRCRCFERPISVTHPSRSSVMTKGRERGQEKLRGHSAQINRIGQCQGQSVQSAQSRCSVTLKQETPSNFCHYHQTSVSCSPTKRKTLDSIVITSVSGVGSGNGGGGCRSCQLAQEICLRQEGIRRDFALDLPRTVARCSDDGPTRCPSRPGVSPHPPTTICHAPPNLNPFLDTRLAPSEHL